MNKRCVPIVVWLIVAALMPAVVSAQGGSGGEPPPPDVRRPYRGLFTGLSTRRTPQSLVFSASLFGAYDDNVLAGLQESNSRDWRLQGSGIYGGATAGLDYGISRQGRRVDFGAQAGAHVRHYRQSELSNTVPDYRAAFSAGFALTNSTRLSVGHAILYSYSYRFFAVSAFEEEEQAGAAGLIVSDPALDLFDFPVLRNTTNVALTQNLGRYTSLGFGYGLRSVNFLDDETTADEAGGSRLTDYTTQSGSARIQYDRPLTTHSTLNLGYGIRFSESRHGTGESRIMHDVRAGVGYSRALSFSRRTSLSFATGSALSVSEDLNDPGSEGETRTHFRLTGNVDLLHELGRTWTARVGYFRGFVFREGFDEPFFTEGVMAGIGGLVTRRLSFSAVGTWSLSTLQRDGRTGQNSFQATAQSTYALSRFLALFANYVYYRYNFEEDVPLDPRFPRDLNRQGVRAGITTSIPLIR